MGSDFALPGFTLVRDIGSGNFGVAKLAREESTGALMAVKYIERGSNIDENVQREIVNHRSLRHANVVQFLKVYATSSHLAIVMEFAAGGELFNRVCNAGRFGEEEARYYFKQLVEGVAYCHSQGVVHRDLKLENIVLDGSQPPQLKICDFGYSKSSLLHSQPKSTVGTPAYIAPEVLSRQQYDGMKADVWSCGVTLYVMLVGCYPFEDPKDSKNFRHTINRILEVNYTIPKYCKVSEECKAVFQAIFVRDPAKRMTIEEVRQCAWLQKPFEGGAFAGGGPVEAVQQSLEEIEAVLAVARRGEGTEALAQDAAYGSGLYDEYMEDGEFVGGDDFYIDTDALSM